MPIYEYVCPTCGNAFDKLVRSATTAAAIVCPTCGSGEVRKKLSTIAVTMNGGSASASNSSASACAPTGL
jgi:putative FmdB family regulatory protein